MKKMILTLSLFTFATAFAESFYHPNCQYQLSGFDSMEQVEEFLKVKPNKLRNILIAKKLYEARVDSTEKEYINLDIGVIGKNVRVSLESEMLTKSVRSKGRKAKRVVKKFLRNLPKCIISKKTEY